MDDVSLNTFNRFFSKIKQIGSCWVWQAADNGHGYGAFGLNYKMVGAHRFSYQLFVGEITKGLELDHLCRNRKCVNPRHLELVTRKENLLRGETIPAKHSKKTHCINGHLLFGDNLRIADHGKRRGCKTCEHSRNKQYRKNKEVKSHY